MKSLAWTCALLAGIGGCTPQERLVDWLPTGQNNQPAQRPPATARVGWKPLEGNPREAPLLSTDSALTRAGYAALTSQSSETPTSPYTVVPAQFPPGHEPARKEGSRELAFEDRPVKVLPSRLPDQNSLAGKDTPVRDARDRPPQGPLSLPELTMPPPLPQSLPAPGAETPPSLVPPTPATTRVRPEIASDPAAVRPAVRMFNTRKLSLNFTIKEVGKSGVAAVELWYTRDGRTWKKSEKNVDRPPFVFEAEDEGLYGFTMVARSGVGLSNGPPRPGELPQVWVEVDLTPPAVELQDVKLGEGPRSRELAIAWKASDRNLTNRPITISWSETAAGPWQPLAANLENSGTHVMTVPQTCPSRFFLRVEAIDMVGNVGTSRCSEPVQLDTSVPQVSIVEVAPGK